MVTFSASLSFSWADVFFLGSTWWQDQGFEVSSGQKRWEFYVVGLDRSFSTGILMIIIHEPQEIVFSLVSSGKLVNTRANGLLGERWRKQWCLSPKRWIRRVPKYMGNNYSSN